MNLPPHPPSVGWRAAPSPGGLAASLALVAAATGFGHLLLPFVPAASIPLVFLVVVLVAAASFGFWTGMAAAVTAFLSANFFFVAPIHTFSVAHPQDVLALGVFLIAAALTGLIAGRMREQADAARRRADMLEIVSAFTADLSSQTTLEGVEAAMVRHLARAAYGAAVLLDVPDGRLALRLAAPEGVGLEDADLQAADWTARHGASQAAALPGWAGSRYSFHPVRRGDSVVAVVGVMNPQGAREREQVIEAVLRQGAVARERVAFAQEAAAARAAAEEEKLRSALLSSISHDLRTPLATILGSVTTLRELGDDMPAEARADLLAAIEEETGRLSRFVANLLAMTRLEAGVAVKRDWVDVADILRAALARGRAAFPSQALNLSLGPGLPLVRADATLLEQAVFNLIDNAARHSPDGAEIQLSAGVADAVVAIAVEDRGPGVPADMQAKIFDKFFTTAASGVGLGLAICRGVVVALGGAIVLESPATEPGGARFTIRLPIEKPDQPP